MDHIFAAIHQAAQFQQQQQQHQQQQQQQQQRMFQVPPMPMMHLQLRGNEYVYAPPMDCYGNTMSNFSQLGQEQDKGDNDVDNDDDEEDDEEQRTIFCGNLDERVTEEILYEIFLQAGPIDNVRIPVDPAGRQRNFGFVTYQHLCAVPFALELYQGLELFQKKVNMKPQGKPPPSREHEQQRSRNRNSFNPFSPETSTSGGSRHVRHSLHDTKPYDRQQELRRRSDSSILDRKRSRPQQQHQNYHHNSGGNRRSEQRNNQGNRRL